MPTFKELGFNWIDGAYRGIGMPKSTPPEARKRMSDLWAALNSEPEMKELAFKSGFELVNVGVDKMDAFMKERTKAYMEVAKRTGWRSSRIRKGRGNAPPFSIYLLEIRDLARLSRQLEDVHAGIGAIDNIDITAIVDFGVIGLDRDLAAVARHRP